MKAHRTILAIALILAGCGDSRGGGGGAGRDAGAGGATGTSTMSDASASGAAAGNTGSGAAGSSGSTGSTGTGGSTGGVAGRGVDAGSGLAGSGGSASTARDAASSNDGASDARTNAAADAATRDVGSAANADVRPLDAPNVANVNCTAMVPGPIAAQRPHPATAVAYNGHWYQYFKAGVCWNAAHAACEALGGYLACVSDQAENTFLASLIMRGDSAYVGGHSLRSPRVWEWLDGTPMTFTNWQPGKPDHPGMEYWMKLVYDGRWDDGYLPWSYICEWDR